VISSFAITKAALRASIMPKMNFSLLGDHFHRLYLLGWLAYGAKFEPSLYGIRSESAKRGAHSLRQVY
jgi:hypothetical protein